MTILALTIWIFFLHRDLMAVKKRLKDHEIVTLANTKGIMTIFAAIESNDDQVIH